jgi:1-deoxy-D-xylulose-5-phosphate synthase
VPNLLAKVTSPAELRRLDPAQLPQLAAEIREFLVAKVSRTGGHLGPNLGAVELTIAVHRVFDSPIDRILWDTGHQAYVHKMLTGRQAGFDKLRQRGGLSGYPSRAESEHDLVENSHASTALSYADGLAKAFALRNERRTVVAVVGDGALTGGMCWEALNNIAAAERPVVIVVNDNGRSYSPTIGGLADHLAALRLRPGYEKVLDMIKETLPRTPLVGGPLYEALHGIKKGIKDVLAPQGLFEDLGMKYVGPVDGHDMPALESALRRARSFGGPVIVHCVTRKGLGYGPAEQDDEDNLHSPPAFDHATGRPLAAGGPTWTGVFADELVAIGAQRPDVVAITAAMLHPTGLNAFAAAYPDRTYDVGIAEQHAVASAAGLAMGGLHPVAAIYATFLNRAFDQVLMDVAMHRLGVTFVLDRAGITGTDGPSHNGMWDLAILGVVPGLRLAAPRDGATLRAELREALAVDDAPTVLRFPKTALPTDIPALRQSDGLDVLAEPAGVAEANGSAPVLDVLLVAVGSMAGTTLAVADRIGAEGITATVVDPRWVQPLPPGLVPLARRHRLVVTVEDGVRVGGVGSRVSQLLRDAAVTVPSLDIGIPAAFLEIGTVGQVQADVGLTAQDIARQILERVSSLDEAADTTLTADLHDPGPPAT